MGQEDKKNKKVLTLLLTSIEEIFTKQYDKIDNELQ